MSALTISLPTDTLAALAETKVPRGVIIPCDDRCMFAKNDECDCLCEGKNHQQGHRLTAVQMYQPRTNAGRAIKTLVVNSGEYKKALKWLRLRDEQGMSQKAIAAAYGVSAPCVRRAIRALNYTIAIVQAQAAEQA